VKGFVDRNEYLLKKISSWCFKKGMSLLDAEIHFYPVSTILELDNDKVVRMTLVRYLL
jgi:hypothetical protein